jgi:FSR family fosmidomycin resistance protein-like MFS transporter
MTSQQMSGFLVRVKSFFPRQSLGLVALTLMHFLVDLHSGMLPIILLYQRVSLQLTLTQIGILAGVYNFSLSLAQPFFGYLADRWGEKRFAIGGVLWIALLWAGLGFAPTYLALLVLSTLAGFGSSSFHPAGASSASRYNPGSRGAGMSFFLVGGSVGYAVGPLVAAGIFENFGLHGTWIISLCALTLTTLLVVFMNPFKITLPAQQKIRPAEGNQAARSMAVSAAVLGGILAVIVLSGARTWIYQGLSNFIPQQMAAQGFSNTRATYWLSTMLIINSAGVLIGGPLTDRFGPRRIITGSMLLLAPVLLLVAGSNPGSIGIFSSMAGFLVGFPVAAIMLVGQSFLPRGTSLASGLVLGISFTIGAIGIALTGVIADHSSLTVAILVFAGLAVLGAITGLVSPKTMPPLPVSTVPH